jgi:hypothetical protein
VRNNYLQKKVTAGRMTLPVAIIISITCWVLASFLLPSLPEKKTTYSLFQVLDLSAIPYWANKAVSFILYAIIGYSLIELNSTFAIIRMRASVQTSLFLLFTAACPVLHQLHAGNITAIAILLSIYFLFKSYQVHQSSGDLFHSFLFIGIGSLAFPQFVILIPIWLIGAYNLQSLNIRSFFAAIIGWSIPYWFLFGHAYYHGDMALLYKPFIDLASFQPINFRNVSLSDTVTIAYLFILFAVSSIHCLVTSYQDKIRTRSYLRFLIFLNFCLFILLALQPMHIACLLSSLLVGVSILVGHLFVLTRNKISNLFFIFSLIGLISLYIFNLWMLL